MSRIRPIAWVILVIAIALLSWQFVHKQTPANPPGQDSADAPGQIEANRLARDRHPGDASSQPSSTAPDQLVAPDATSAAPRARSPSPSSALPVPETAESSSLPAATVLENMRTSIRQYASVFGENPVGTNEEITKALQGGNSKQINFLKEDGNRVNSNGELVDVWGTPYFFHQISGHEMEIRSAGPDRIMYTGDDLVIR
ncbi:MAG TPA: hypothetical protein VFE51_03250 [Verrucomicrobiae bacterium]|nr:hypothetical protein [Verrucomicrobiae bacterium]